MFPQGSNPSEDITAASPALLAHSSGPRRSCLPKCASPCSAGASQWATVGHIGGWAGGEWVQGSFYGDVANRGLLAALLANPSVACATPWMQIWQGPAAESPASTCRAGGFRMTGGPDQGRGRGGESLTQAPHSKKPGGQRQGAGVPGQIREKCEVVRCVVVSLFAFNPLHPSNPPGSVLPNKTCPRSFPGPSS